MTQCFWAINTIKLGLIEIKILAYSLYKTSNSQNIGFLMWIWIFLIFRVEFRFGFNIFRVDLHTKNSKNPTSNPNTNPKMRNWKCKPIFTGSIKLGLIYKYLKNIKIKPSYFKHLSNKFLLSR